MAHLDRHAVGHQLDLSGLSQREVARRAGVSEPTFSRALRGHAVSRDTLRRIAAALLELEPAPGVALVLAQPADRP